MAKAKNNQYKPGEIIEFNNQSVEIRSVDYVDNVYIFEEILLYHWSKWKSMTFEMFERITQK